MGAEGGAEKGMRRSGCQREGCILREASCESSRATRPLENRRELFACEQHAT